MCTFYELKSPECKQPLDDVCRKTAFHKQVLDCMPDIWASQASAQVLFLLKGIVSRDEIFFWRLIMINMYFLYMRW
jgi:hypothetical protein